jgi:hypothetical protein
MVNTTNNIGFIINTTNNKELNTNINIELLSIQTTTFNHNHQQRWIDLQNNQQKRLIDGQYI